MKLRIRDKSVCMRLTREEVDALSRQGVVSTATRFPGRRTFRYTIESSPAIVQPSAFYSENEITVRVPESSVLAWATSEQAALAGEQRLGDGEILSVSVKKDFEPASTGVDAPEPDPCRDADVVDRN